MITILSVVNKKNKKLFKVECSCGYIFLTPVVKTKTRCKKCTSISLPKNFGDLNKHFEQLENTIDLLCNNKNEDLVVIE